MATIALCFSGAPTYSVVVAANLDRVRLNAAHLFVKFPRATAPLQPFASTCHRSSNHVKLVLACFVTRLVQHLVSPPPVAFPSPVRFSNNLTVISPVDVLTGRSACLGVTNSGRFALATAVCDTIVSSPATPQPVLSTYVESFLGSVLTAETFLTDFAAKVAAVAAVATPEDGGSRLFSLLGFNLIVGDGAFVGYYSNRAAGTPTLLSPGVYTISNGLLNTPWPKTEWLRGRVAVHMCEYMRFATSTADLGVDLGVDAAGPAGAAVAAPAVSVPPVRKVNYNLCELLLAVLSDASLPLFNAGYHSLPPAHYLPLAVAAFLSRVLDPVAQLAYGALAH